VRSRHRTTKGLEQGELFWVRAVEPSVNANLRKKLPPRDLEKRSHTVEPLALKPALVSSTLFVSGALVLALSSSVACSHPVASPEPYEQKGVAITTVAVAPVAAESEEPEHIVAPEAPCHSASSSAKNKPAPVPTTVAIRPGRPMHMAGGIRAMPPPPQAPPRK
jgi:hypothetical protein